jgi:NTE family protein
MEQRTGLILTGGGARAAYQVGVLKAIAELFPRNAHNPFPIICGTSAGALNATALAINAQKFRYGVRYLERVWKGFHASQIYRTDAIGVFNNSALWFTSILLSGIGIKKLKQISLLDSSPLVGFLERILPYEKIQESVEAGYVHALSITASGYTSGQSVTFYQGAKDLTPWRRTQRIGIPATIEIKHLLASSAIPFIFPAVRINREFFGDGSMHQIAPISSALHLGATRVLVIDVTSDNTWTDNARHNGTSEPPSLAHIAGHALSSIFQDNISIDLERVHQVNKSVAQMSPAQAEDMGLKHVDVLRISPSQEIDSIAEQYATELPWTIRLLLRLIGAVPRGGGVLVSYLLSEKKFSRALIDLGYQDAMRRREEILNFFEISTPTTNINAPEQGKTK